MHLSATIILVHERYKLKLVNPTEARFEQLVTQMKWRLAEGDGEAVYEIGVADDGTLEGLSAEDLEGSLVTLSRSEARHALQRHAPVRPPVCLALLGCRCHTRAHTPCV